MGMFRDDKGREYTIVLLPRTISRVRMATRNHTDVNGDIIFDTEINLFECMTNGDLARLDDPYLRAIVVYYLCKEDVDRYGISEGEFLDAIVSVKTMKAIEVALLEAISCFFPGQAAAVAKMQKAKETIASAVTSAIDRASEKAKIATDVLTDEMLERIVDVVLENNPSKLSTMSSQELQELIQKT